MWYLNSSSLSLFLFSHFPLKDSPSLPSSTREIKTQPSTIGRHCLGNVWFDFSSLELSLFAASFSFTWTPARLPERLPTDQYPFPAVCYQTDPPEKKKKKKQGIMSNHAENCRRPYITDQLTCQVLSTAYWEGLGHRGDTDEPEQALEQTRLCHIRMMVRRPNWLEQEVLVVIVTRDWVRRWRVCPDRWTPENQLEIFLLYSSIHGELWHVTSRRGR